jgi:hypothetical protein
MRRLRYNSRFGCIVHVQGDHLPRGKKLDPAILEAALAGLEAKRRRLDEQITQVRSLLGSPRRGRPRAGGADSVPSVAQAPKKRRTMSAAARKRIALAQKKRWAEFRKKQAA